MAPISRPFSLKQWLALSIVPMFLICGSIWLLWGMHRDQSAAVHSVVFPPGFSKIGEADVDSTSYRSLSNFKNADSSNGSVFLYKGGLIEVQPVEIPPSQVPGQLQQGAVYLIENVKNVHGSSHEPGYPPEENVLMSYVTLLGPNGRFEFGWSEFDRESKVSMLMVFKPNDSTEFRSIKAKYDLQSVPVLNSR